LKISLIQAAINRNEKPDWGAINQEIEKRLEKYYRQIAEQSQAVESAQKVLSSLLSEEDAKKLKEVFYVLCRRLHPDVNPGQTEEQKDLFIKVKAAYDLQNLQELQSILLYLDEGGNSDILTHSSDEKRRRIEQLEKNIADLKEKMNKLEKAFPFNAKSLLYDDEQLTKRRQEIQDEIDNVVSEIGKQQMILDLLEDE
jgi:Mg2+ and Co2+ transporter CorA